ncbi:hypothetical protein VNO77_30509 [Canavalia gladiata]|uniref:Uncharacterized protein n=1 Tax=Canavalia gladiata TaxID=3824 RepID=A0AAN9KPI4_CANGL
MDHQCFSIFHFRQLTPPPIPHRRKRKTMEKANGDLLFGSDKQNVQDVQVQRLSFQKIANIDLVERIRILDKTTN